MRLDISEKTAALLTAALVEPPDSSREASLAAAMADDRGFHAWVCHAASENDSAEATRWLSAHLLESLSTVELDASTRAHRTLVLLVARLREVCNTEQSFSERLEAEKLAAMRELAYGASHEINNPLANIASRAQTLMREEKDPEKRRKLATINAQAFRAFEMIADLMLFAKPPQPQKQPVALQSLVDSVLAELADDAAEQRTELVRGEASEAITVNVDRTQIEMAIRSLVRNSLEAIGAGGQVSVAVRSAAAVPDAEPTVAEVVVADTGPGIPPELRPRVFDPYFSGREAGRGLGLGLSKCWRIAELHGGRVLVDSPPQGARLRLQLPLQ